MSRYWVDVFNLQLGSQVVEVDGLLITADVHFDSAHNSLKGIIIMDKNTPTSENCYCFHVLPIGTGGNQGDVCIQRYAIRTFMCGEYTIFITKSDTKIEKPKVENQNTGN